MGLKPYQITQRGIARTFQNIRLFSELTVLDNMRIGFKSDVFQTILQGMPSEEVIMTLADQTRAGLILPAENAPGISLCNLLLPMKLIGE